MSSVSAEEMKCREQYSKRLRQLREERGLTFAQVAEVISRSPKSYEKIEACESKMKINELIDLCDFYGVSSDYLLDRKKPNN